MRNHYPWKVKALTDWLNREFGPDGKSTIEATLQIPGYTIQSWYVDGSPLIKLSDIRQIARCRGWSLSETVNWLEIKPAHMQELIDQELSELNSNDSIFNHFS